MVCIKRLNKKHDTYNCLQPNNKTNRKDPTKIVYNPNNKPKRNKKDSNHNRLQTKPNRFSLCSLFTPLIRGLCPTRSTSQRLRRLAEAAGWFSLGGVWSFRLGKRRFCWFIGLLSLLCCFDFVSFLVWWFGYVLFLLLCRRLWFGHGSFKHQDHFPYENTTIKLISGCVINLLQSCNHG